MTQEEWIRQTVLNGAEKTYIEVEKELEQNKKTNAMSRGELEETIRAYNMLASLLAEKWLVEKGYKKDEENWD